MKVDEITKEKGIDGKISVNPACQPQVDHLYFPSIFLLDPSMHSSSLHSSTPSSFTSVIPFSGYTQKEAHCPMSFSVSLFAMISTYIHFLNKGCVAEHFDP